MRELELMQEIGRYNEVDCRAMAEIVAWLRANR
jgi:predicted RecB family nuclease